MPRQLCLCRIGHEAKRTQIEAKLLRETAHPLQRAVQPCRLPIAGAAQFSDQPLRLSKRIGAHQDTAIRIGLARSDQLADLLLDRGMTEYGESKSCFRDEDVAGCRDEWKAGRIGPALVVARDDHPFACIFEQYLRRTQYVDRKSTRLNSSHKCASR